MCIHKYYLGFAFTTTLSVKQGTDHLVAKGKKAIFSLYTSFQKCKEMTKETFFNIFDKRFSQFVVFIRNMGATHTRQHRKSISHGM